MEKEAEEEVRFTGSGRGDRLCRACHCPAPPSFPHLRPQDARDAREQKRKRPADDDGGRASKKAKR